MGIAKGRVEPCEPVPAPDGSGPFGLPNSGGGTSDYIPKGDKALGQAAIAETLHQTATVAEASDAPVEAPPASGQFLYTKTNVAQLQGWLPKGHGKGSKKNPRYFVPITDPSARYALVSTLKEVWTAPDGKTRVRETLGRIEFLSDSDQRSWEDAGSPPPWAFDPSEHDVHRDGSGRLVKEFASRVLAGSQGLFPRVPALRSAHRARSPALGRRTPPRWGLPGRSLPGSLAQRRCSGRKALGNPQRTDCKPGAACRYLQCSRCNTGYWVRARCGRCRGAFR